MKRMILVAALFSSVALADGSITLRPGSIAIVEPGESTEVRCEAVAVDDFCRCTYTPRLGHYLELKTYRGDSWQSHMLGQYESAEACNERLDTHPSCD